MPGLDLLGDVDHKTGPVLPLLAAADVPTPISHAALGYALGVWGQRQVPIRRVSIAAAACAALPDIDLLFYPYLAHRGITHSLVFALIGAILATAILFPRDTSQPRRSIAIVLFLALLSHSCIDALSTYSVGIEFFAPFSEQRYRFLWTPLGDPAGRLSRQLLQETLVVLFPALLLVWLGLRTNHSR